MLLGNINLNKLAVPLETMGTVSKFAMRQRLARTCSLIRALHKGQQDKSGRPYWHHSYRVMKRLEAVPGVTEYILHAALLHDVVEDTDTGLSDLWQLGYPYQTLVIVDEVTRRIHRKDRGETYIQWISWLAQFACGESRLVKSSDIADNLAPNRLSHLPREMQGIETRYQRALEVMYMGTNPEWFQAIRFGDFIGPCWLEPEMEIMVEGESDEQPIKID